MGDFRDSGVSKVHTCGSTSARDPGDGQDEESVLTALHLTALTDKWS